MDVLDRPFDRLHVVAGVVDLADAPVLARQLCPPEVRKRRALVAWPHVDPHNVALLDDRIGRVPNVEADAAVGRLAGRLQDGAGYVDLPAVVQAAQSTRLVAAVQERRVAMRAVLADDADPALGVAE